MGGWSGFWRVISKFFSTPTTVFVGVFVFVMFFLSDLLLGRGL